MLAAQRAQTRETRQTPRSTLVNQRCQLAYEQLHTGYDDGNYRVASLQLELQVLQDTLSHIRYGTGARVRVPDRFPRKTRALLVHNARINPVPDIDAVRAAAHQRRAPIVSTMVRPWRRTAFV